MARPVVGAASFGLEKQPHFAELLHSGGRLGAIRGPAELTGELLTARS